LKKVIVVLIFASFLIPGIALAHPGRLDINGGHFCRTNCEKWGYKYGEWHHHQDLASAKNVKIKSKIKAKQ